MINYLILLIVSITMLSCKAQNERFDIIEQAINTKDFVTLVNQQTIFNTEKELTIYIDSSLIDSVKYRFNNKEVGYYDISDPINKMSVTYNFLFTQLDFDQNEAQVNFTFYPNWLIDINGKKHHTYNNGNYIKVACSFVKNYGSWKLEKTKIEDIEFQDWMFEKGSGFEYFTQNYIPLKE